MNLWEKAHCLHRFWRYRLSTERSSIQYLRNLNLTGKTVIDLGANKGAYSYWLSRAVGQEGKVYAFEPQPELDSYLREVKAGFNLSNLEIVGKAASNTNGIARLSRKYAGHGGAQIVGESLPGSVEVETSRLDNLELPGEIAFVKCDVEGHELEALKGAELLLIKHQPILQVEVHHEAALKGSVFSFLESLGYHGFFIHKGELIPTERFQEFPYPRSDNHRNYIFRM